MKNIFKTLLIVVGVVSSSAFAAKAFITGNVTKTLSSNTLYGGCVAKLSVSVSEAGLNCGYDWVTFSCSGDFNGKDVASRNFDTATMSMILDKQITVRVDDTKKHNGYCFADRIYIYK